MRTEKVVGSSLFLLCVIVVLCTSGVVAIESQAPANQSETTVESASLSDSSVETGKSVEITAEIRNTGDNARVFPAKLLIDDRTRDTELVRVGSNTTETVTFRESFEQAGSYEIAVNDQLAGVLEVNEPAPAELEITETVLSDQSITIGETATVEANVENIGDETDDFRILLIADGKAINNAILGIPPRASRTVEFEFEPDETGTYTLAVQSESANEPVGQLEVTEPAAFEVGSPSVSQEPVLVDEQTDIAVEIENVGGTEGTITAPLNIDGDTVETTKLTLAAGETEEVSFDYSFEASGTYDIRIADGPATSITVQEPADISLSDTEISQNTVTTDDPITVIATVSNAGDLSGETAVDLEVDGTVVSTEDVVVDGGDTETVEFTHRIEEPGERTISVNGEFTDTIQVLEPAELSVTSPSISDETIEMGESVTANATVTNVGGVSGTFIPELEIDGESVDSTELELDSDESAEISFREQFDSPGEYTLRIGETEPMTVTVLEPANITVISAEVGANSTTTDEALSVSASLENSGDLPGEGSATLEIGDQAVETTDADVPAGEQQTVQFQHEFDETGNKTVSVNGEFAGEVSVLEPATFEVKSATVDQETMLVGEQLTVTATVKNSGDVTGSFTGSLEVDGSVIGSDTANIAGGETVGLSFDHEIDRPGTYDLSVASTSAGTVRVDRPARLEVVNTTLSEAVILENETVTIGADLKNTGDRDGTFEINLSVNGTTRVMQSVQLQANESETVSLEQQFESAGSYDISVANTSTGTVTVDRPAEIELLEKSVTPEHVMEGDTVEIIVAVTNTGDRSGTKAFDITVEGSHTDTHNVTVPAQSNRTIRVVEELSSPGEYAVTVNETTAGTVLVDEEPTFEIREANVLADWALAGSETTLRAVAANPGNWTTTQPVVITVDQEVIATEEVTLDSGERRELTIEFEAKDGTVAINGVDAGYLRADNGSTGTVQPPDSGDSWWDFSLLWLLPAVVAILSFILYLFVSRDWVGGDG